VWLSLSHSVCDYFYNTLCVITNLTFDYLPLGEPSVVNKMQICHVTHKLTRKKNNIQNNVSSLQGANIESSCTSGTFAHITAYRNEVWIITLKRRSVQSTRRVNFPGLTIRLPGLGLLFARRYPITAPTLVTNDVTTPVEATVAAL